MSLLQDSLKQATRYGSGDTDAIYPADPHHDTMTTQHSDTAHGAMASPTAEQSEEPEQQQPQPTTYKVYRLRYLILALYSIGTFMTAALWITYAPQLEAIAAFYNTSVDSVDLFAYLFIITFPPFLLLTLIISRGWGVATAFKLGCGLTALASFLRILVYALPHNNFSLSADTTALSPDQSAFATTWYILHFTGQLLAGIAQPPLLTLSTQIPSYWFPDNEVTIAIFIASLSNSLGVVCGAVFTPTIMNWMKEQYPEGGAGYVGEGMEFISLMQALLCIALYILSLLFFEETPPTPPSDNEVKRLLIHDKEQKELMQWWVEHEKLLHEQEDLAAFTSATTTPTGLYHPPQSGKISMWNKVKLFVWFLLHLSRPIISSTWRLLKIPNFLFLTIPFSCMMGVMNVVLSSPHIIPAACMHGVTVDIDIYTVPMIMGVGVGVATLFSFFLSALPLREMKPEDDSTTTTPRGDDNTTTGRSNIRGGQYDAAFARQHASINFSSSSSSTAGGHHNNLNEPLMFIEEDEYNIDFPTNASTLSFGSNNNENGVASNNNNNNHQNNHTTTSSALAADIDPDTPKPVMVPMGINKIIKCAYLAAIVGTGIFFTRLQETTTNSMILGSLALVGATALPILPTSLDSILSITYPEFDPQLTASILLFCAQIPSLVFLPLAMTILTLPDYEQCATATHTVHIFGTELNYGLLLTKFGMSTMVMMLAMFVLVFQYTGRKQKHF